MDHERDAAAGIDLARRALRQLADGDDARALVTLNSASRAEVSWAASYLLTSLVESVESRFGPGEATRAAIYEATADDGDVLLTQVGLALDKADRT